MQELITYMVETSKTSFPLYLKPIISCIYAAVVFCGHGSKTVETLICPLVT